MLPIPLRPQATLPGLRHLVATTMALATSVLAPSDAASEILQVPSQFSTIQAAIDATAEGDEVVLAPGVYEGVGNTNLVLPAWDITVRSSDGAMVTVLQGDLMSDRQAFATGGPSADTVIQGLTMRFFAFTEGGAIHCRGGGLTILDCVFENNYAWQGGGVRYDGGAEGAVIGCRFIGNEVWGTGGGLSSSSPILLRDCEFRGNYALDIFKSPPAGAAVYGIGLTIEDCLVAGNRSQGKAGGIYLVNGEIRRCTIVGNRVAGLHLVGNADITESIIWGNCSGPQIVTDDGFSVIGCSIFEGGTGGTGVLLAAPGLISDDPLFCNPAPCGRTVAGDYSLQTASPAWAAHNSCGVLFGAVDTDCAASSVEDPTTTASLPRTVALGAPVPNPFRAAFELPVWMQAQGRIDLRVVDATGRIVWSESRELDSGESRVSIRLNDGAPRLPAGVYHVIGVAAGEHSTRSVVYLGAGDR